MDLKVIFLLLDPDTNFDPFEISSLCHISIHIESGALFFGIVFKLKPTSQIDTFLDMT